MSQEIISDKPLNIIFNFHPAACLHQPRLWAVMLNDWSELPKTVDASYTLSPKVIKPKDACYALDTENDPTGKLGQWSIAYRDSNGRLTVTPFFGSNPRWKLDGLCIMQNAKWDIKVLRNNGMTPPENIVDTMIAAYCLGLGRQAPINEGITDPSMVGGLGLKYLARRHLGMNMLTWEDVKDKPELVPEYNAADSVATYLLWEKWEKKLPKFFWDIDMPLLPVIMKMEARGIAIDPKMLKTLDKYLDQAIKDIDLPLNPFSTTQVSKYIYQDLGVVPFKFTPSGAPSVDEDVLETIDDPVVKLILQYKKLYKEKDTYVDNYVNKITKDSRIHCEFKQTRTSTARLSSANPNLQNVPVEGEMRKLFVAAEGNLLIRADAKQIELICNAIIAPEPRLLAMYKRMIAGEDIDVHQDTAKALKVERGFAKHLNFMMQNCRDVRDAAWKLSMELKIPMNESYGFVEAYYKRYPGLLTYKQRIIADSKVTKTVTNYYGRSLRVDALFADDWRIRKEGEREAICFPVQSLAAEVIKRVMIALDKKNAPMILQVHDELIFEVPKKEAIEYAHWLKEFMPTVTEIDGIRFPYEVGVGQNWVEAKENEI